MMDYRFSFLRLSKSSAYRLWSCGIKINSLSPMNCDASRKLILSSVSALTYITGRDITDSSG